MKNEQLKTLMQIEEICNTPALKKSGVQIVTVIFNKWLFDKMETWPDLPSEAVLALCNDQAKLTAVKIYKDHTGLPLLECKRAIESFMFKQWGFERFPQKQMITKTH